MTRCLFVSDLHGDGVRYDKLFKIVASEGPAAVFVGGDSFPAKCSFKNPCAADFVRGFLTPEFELLRRTMSRRYPRVFFIMGNDDERAEEPAVKKMEQLGLLEYVHNRSVSIGPYSVYGYAFVPPTPFQLKDWERYDLSRYVDPGCISPEEGRYSIPVDERERKYATIKADLESLTLDTDLDQAVFLFHAPPYGTPLDRAALDGVVVDGVPLDVHVGSIAIRRFIEERQPLLTLHGHIHESARLASAWKDRVGRTHVFSAAHDGPELAVIRFDLEDLTKADRALV